MMASRSRSTQAQASSEGAYDGKTVFVRCIHSIGPVFPHLSLSRKHDERNGLEPRLQAVKPNQPQLQPKT